MLLGLEGLGYWRDWICWGFFSQECRRLRGELIEVDKIMKGIDMVNIWFLFPDKGNLKLRAED